MRRRYRLGLWRVLLSQPDAEDDQGSDREKLALPVLERLEPELGSAEVLEQALRRFPF
jgi:hypothetical protein